MYCRFPLLLLVWTLFVATGATSFSSFFRDAKNYARNLLVYRISWQESVGEFTKKVTDTNDSHVGVFSPRADFASTVYEGHIWVFGGAKDKIYYNDVWKLHPTDPNLWIRVTPGGPNTKRVFSPRYSNEAVVYNGKMWVMGGFTATQGAAQGSLLCDVWSSKDGSSWTQATDDAWYGKCRTEFGAVVFKGSMFGMGGYGGKGSTSKTTMNDVYSSTNGNAWIRHGNSSTIVIGTNRWSRRQSFGLVASSEKMYLAGGYAPGKFLNDVWTSEDGMDWNLVNPSTGIFSGRSDFQLLLFDGMLWAVGGKLKLGYSNEVWSGTESAEQWFQMDPSPTGIWKGRDYHSVVTCNGYMYLMGGQHYETPTIREYFANTKSVQLGNPAAEIWRGFVADKECKTRLQLANPYSSCYCHNYTDGSAGGDDTDSIDLPMWAVITILVSILLLAVAAGLYYRRWRKKQKAEREKMIKKLGGKAGMDITKNLDVFLSKRVDTAKTAYGMKGKKTKNLNAK